MLDFACGWTIEWPSSRQVIFLLPRSIIRALCPGNPRLHGRILRSPSGSILSDHLLSLARELPTQAAADAAAVEWALLNLVAGAINETVRTCASRRGSFVDLSLIAARVRRHIDENLTDPDLSAASLCQRLGLSKAILSRAFGPPARVADHICSRRLAIARAMIADSVVLPDLADLASMFCFGSGEQFRKAFLRHFDCEPHEISDAGRRHGPRSQPDCVPGQLMLGAHSIHV